MGFFDFLKGKKQNEQFTDVPPNPEAPMPDFNAGFAPAPGADFKIEVPNFDIPKDPSWETFEEPKQELPVQQESIIPPPMVQEEPHPVELRIEEHVEQEPEEEPIEKVEEKPKKPVQRKMYNGPMFLSIDQCEEIISDLNTSKNGLKKVDDALTRMNGLRQQSDKLSEAMKRDIEVSHHSLMKIDKIIFKR